MLRYVVHRLLVAIPTLFVAVTLAFFLMRLAPGGPFDLDKPLPGPVREHLERIFLLDRPLYEQYLNWLKNCLAGDLGPSLIQWDFTVTELLGHGLPVSVQLGAAALALALGVGGLLGVAAALRQNRGSDYAVMAVATFGVTVPNFVVAPLLTLTLGVWLGWLPVAGWGDGALSHKLLPILTLALPQVAVVARLTRASMIESLRSHHVRTARALGLPARVVVGTHALRSALLPVVSYVGPAAAALLTGSIVIEQIFGIPGVGRYFVQGALSRDYTLVMGTVVLIATFIIVFNLIVDLLYVVLDPRVRFD